MTWVLNQLFQYYSPFCKHLSKLELYMQFLIADSVRILVPKRSCVVSINSLILMQRKKNYYIFRKNYSMSLIFSIFIF